VRPGEGGRLTVSENVLLVDAPVLSFTVTMTLAVPGAVGVPESVPSPATVNVPGRPVADHVSGGTPPVAANLKDTAVPTMAVGIDAVVITSDGAAMVTVNVLVAVAPLESVTVALTVEDPTVVGVPPRVPSEDGVMPAGKPVNVHA
jgi:hypothetical protein